MNECPDWWLDHTQYEKGEYVLWKDVPVGARVHIDSDHGPVVAVNVDSLFCTHRFEDGTERARNRDLEVAIKRPMTEAETEEWLAMRRKQWQELQDRVEANQ